MKIVDLTWITLNLNKSEIWKKNFGDTIPKKYLPLILEIFNKKNKERR